MMRRPDEPELMGAAEAARTLGVAQSNLRVVKGLPEPYQQLASTTLWRAVEIRALAWRRAEARKSRRALKAKSHPPEEKEKVA